MKKYTVEYMNAKASYTAERLDSVAARYGHYGDLRDGDYLAVAVELYCDTHFMWEGAAHCKSVDAETRGDRTRAYEYAPDGVFVGWIYASTEEA